MGKQRVKAVYLDVCVLCRPFDDQSVARIRLETDATFIILDHVRRDDYGLVVSPLHVVELSEVASGQERAELLAFLEEYGVQKAWDMARARGRAEELHRMTFGLADAAHVAFAEASSDVFVTCDDRLLKKCRKTRLGVLALDPVEFCTKEGLK